MFLRVFKNLKKIQNSVQIISLYYYRNYHHQHCELGCVPLVRNDRIRSWRRTWGNWWDRGQHLIEWLLQRWLRSEVKAGRTEAVEVGSGGTWPEPRKPTAIPPPRKPVTQHTQWPVNVNTLGKDYLPHTRAQLSLVPMHYSHSIFNKPSFLTQFLMHLPSFFL